MVGLRILVLGGMHGNEQLGIKLVSLLNEKPIRGVEAIIANPDAVSANSRFVESDLNRSFGKKCPGTLESRRARQIGEITKNYDIVLDVHNTQTPANNCSFVGVNCEPQMYLLTKQLGLLNCIQATYDCINRYCQNTLSIEISEGDSLDNAEYWYKQIKILATKGLTTTDKVVNVYRYQRRVDWAEAKLSKISDWKPFKPLIAEEIRAFKLTGIVVPIFIGSTLTEYYATLISKEEAL